MYFESRHRSMSAKNPESYKSSTSLFSLHTCTCLQIVQVCSYGVSDLKALHEPRSPPEPPPGHCRVWGQYHGAGVGPGLPVLLRPCPTWRVVLPPLPPTLFPHVTSHCSHLIWPLSLAWRRASGCQWEGPLGLLLKERLLSSLVFPLTPHCWAPFHLSPFYHSLVWVTSQTLSSTWGDHFSGILKQNHQHTLSASGQNTIKGVNTGVERTRGHYWGSQILVGLLLLTSLQRGGFEKLVVVSLVMFGTFSYSTTTPPTPALFICVSSLDHKLLTAGNVSESRVPRA